MSAGKLSVESNAIPTFSPPYTTTTTHTFSDVTLIAIAYRVTRASIEALVPSALTLADEPLVTSTFVHYGMSSVGQYAEFVQSVEVSYGGETYNHPLILLLDNEAAIFAGREVFGYPKVFGRTVIEHATGTRLVRGHAERPLGREVVGFEFVPEVRGEGMPGGGKRTLNLRVIPAAVPGQPPVVREFVPSSMQLEAKEVWLGKGCVSFPRTSAFDPWVNVEVLRYEGAFYASGVSAKLINPTETFPF